MKALYLIVCLHFLHGCASTPLSQSIQANGYGSLPASVELAETPFFPQTRYQCGPAALATVFQYRGMDTTPDALSGQVYLPGRQGSLQIEVLATARRHGMLPYVLEPSLLDLFQETAAGNPVLIMQNLGLEWFPQWHYAVVIGYDLEHNQIILRSGTSRRWLTSFEVFERTWQRADHWALVIVPADLIPATAKPLPFLKTVYAFEATGKPELALKAYQAATERWPDKAVTWMALGNLALASHDPGEAVRALTVAIRLQPESITGWNNLAYALQAYGCSHQALTALQCGLHIAPDDSNLLDTRADLAAHAVNPGHTECPVMQCR
jgi:hypothetical protein